jgi:SAM-dependent methyltransferase
MGNDPPPGGGTLSSLARSFMNQTDGVDNGDPAPRESFDRVPDIYHDIRPGYPSALFDDLFALLGARPHILEVGPGTGQATRDLLDHGATVHAIEIGPAMADKLCQVIPAKELTVTVGNFEEVPDARSTYDCVFAATSYHWIEPRAQLKRPSELLKPGGVIAIVDAIQVDSPNDRGFFVAAQPVYERYGEGHIGAPAPRREDVDPPMHMALQYDDRFAQVRVRCYDWDQTYTAAQYRRLMLSYSPTQMMEPVARRGLLDDMEAFIEEHFDDRVTRPLVIALTTAATVA